MREGDALSLPKGWKEVKIDDLGTIGRGKSKHRPRNADFLFGDKYPFVQTADVKDAEYKIYNYSQMYSEAGLAQSKLWPKGTLCITIAANIADAAILGIDACFPDSVVGFLPDDTKSDVRFVKYLFDLLQVRIKKISQGAAQDNLSLEKIRTLNFQVPPLETQKKIASILSGYDDLIENNLKRIKILEEMAQQTYEEWFVRMRFPGHETAEIIAETGLPEGWEKVKLGEMCNITMGQSPKSEYYNDTGDGLPFHQGVKDYGFRFPINKSWSTQGNKVAKAGSVLFSVRAPVGRINVASEEIILGRGLAAISHKKRLNSFLLYQLKNIFFEDNMIGGGAIYASVTKNDMERIEMIFCDNYAQKFNSYAHNIDQSILNLTLQNQRLREARDILLPRLMMGMVEV